MNRHNLLIEIPGLLILNIIFSLIVSAIAPAFGFWTCYMLVLVGYFFIKLISYQRTRFLGKAGITIIALYAGYLFITSTFPMTTRTAPWLATKADFAASKVADSVKIKADLLYDGAMNQALDKALEGYTALLKAGKPDLAVAYLDSLTKKWDKDAIKARLQPREETKPVVINQPVQPTQPAPPSQASPKPQPQSQVLKLGNTYQFNLKTGQETPWLSFQPCSKFHYDISSPNSNFKIIFSDGTQYNGDPDVVIPYKNSPTFKILAKGDELVTIKVS